MSPLLFYWRAAAACTDTVVLALICMCKCQWQGRCGDPGFRSRPVAQTISWGLCHGSFSLTSILDSGCTTQKLFRNNLDFCPDNSNKKKWCTKPLQTIFQLLIKMGQESSSSKQLLTVPVGGVCHWQIGKCLGACMVGRKHNCWNRVIVPPLRSSRLQCPCWVSPSTLFDITVKQQPQRELLWKDWACWWMWDMNSKEETLDFYQCCRLKAPGCSSGDTSTLGEEYIQDIQDYK